MWFVFTRDGVGKIAPLASGTTRAELEDRMPHVVPCSVEGETINMGYHELKMDCPCHPQLKEKDGITFAVHTTRTQ